MQWFGDKGKMVGRVPGSLDVEMFMTEEEALWAVFERVDSE